jgi:hypothetical protein
MKLSCLAAGSLGLLLLLRTSAAHAQMSPDLIMETYNSNIRVITDGAINKAMMKKVTERHAAASRLPATSKTAGKTTTTATRLAYTSTPALRQQTVQGYVTRLKPTNPAAAQAISSVFGPGKYDYGQVYRTLIDGHGLRDNNAADALTAFMLVGYMIVNDVRDDKSITPTKAQAVRAQLTPLLTQNQLLSKPGAVAQTGEEMKLQTVIIQGGWQSALKENTLPAYRQSIATLFSTQYGLDLRQLRLTDSGFAGR